MENSGSSGDFGLDCMLLTLLNMWKKFTLKNFRVLVTFPRTRTSSRHPELPPGGEVPQQAADRERILAGPMGRWDGGGRRSPALRVHAPWACIPGAPAGCSEADLTAFVGCGDPFFPPTAAQIRD